MRPPIAIILAGFAWSLLRLRVAFWARDAYPDVDPWALSAIFAGLGAAGALVVMWVR